jgi:hypothetical protein
MAIVFTHCNPRCICDEDDMNSRFVEMTANERAALEVVKLIRKLRWIGMETEAEELQIVLGEFPSDRRASVLAPPHGTD